MVSSLFNYAHVFIETAAQYEARISVLQSQPVEWRRASGQNVVSVELCLLSEIVSKCPGLDPNSCISLLVRSVEGKPGWMQRVAVTNRQHRSPTASQRPSLWRRRTGRTTNQRSSKRRQRERGRHSQQTGIFRCDTATLPRCPPSP